MAFDFKKEYREFYMPKNKPEIVNVPKANYIAVRGKGNPNEEGGAYQQAISVLYAVAYTLKMSYKTDYKIEGFFEYVVPPLEGFWWQDGVDGADYTNKSTFNWISVIRLPDFITEKDFMWAVETATKKKKLDCSSAEFLTIDEGLCVQIMHLGDFDDESASVALMDEYLKENGYANDITATRLHHEIYMSDARKVAPEKWKTVIRHPIKKNDDFFESTEVVVVDEFEELKSNLGLEVVLNEMLSTELIENGYRKMSVNEVAYIEPLFEIAPQLVVDRINKVAVQRAFKEANANSYKCILDPTKHLATIKGTTDVYIGGALDNKTNQVAGQARWLKNDVQLSVSNLPNVALNAFNALSVITGQYFMSQVNANLSEINSGIKGIQKYLEDKEESELETAFQELSDILAHLQFIRKSSDRVNSTIVQLDSIRNVSKNSINLHKKQIDNVIKTATSTDKETIITENLNKIRKSLIQYRFAVYIYNLAHILKIYLTNVTDVEELSLYRDELESIIDKYKVMYENAITWSENYLDDTNALNKSSKMQIILSLGTGVALTLMGGKYSSYKLGGQAASLVNDLFDEKRSKKKNQMVISHEEYKSHMSDMQMVEASITAMDNYINATRNTAEVVMCEGEYYIKYLENKEE